MILTILLQKKLSNFEQETYEAKRARELELSATKKEIEKRKDTVDKVDKRVGTSILLIKINNPSMNRAIILILLHYI